MSILGASVITQSFNKHLLSSHLCQPLLSILGCLAVRKMPKGPCCLCGMVIPVLVKKWTHKWTNGRKEYLSILGGVGQAGHLRPQKAAADVWRPGRKFLMSLEAESKGQCAFL